MRWRGTIAGGTGRRLAGVAVAAVASVAVATAALPATAVAAPLGQRGTAPGSPGTAAPDPGTGPGASSADTAGRAPANGQSAIDLLGGRLPEVAAVHGLTPSELARTFREDPTVWVDRTDRLYVREPALEPGAEANGAPAASASAPFPLEDTFALESRPSSQRTIYLDFDGHLVENTAWNVDPAFGSLASFSAEPYDSDGSPATFSEAEQAVIQDVWRRVAEDYAPFDVNVTTADPGEAALVRTDGADQVYGTRVVIDGDTPDQSCSCGGYAYIGTFDVVGSGYYQPSWVYQGGLGGNLATAKKLAEAASHEAGHNLGLTHDGTAALTYYSGHGSWAPIMGVGYDRPVVQWSKGDYPGANNAQDDLAVIASHGATVLADDHADGIAGATPLTGVGPVFTGAGLVHDRADVDVFSFTAPGDELVTVHAEPAAGSPNLDIRLDLLDGSGVEVATADEPVATVSADVASGLDATISEVLPAGTYHVRIDGVGHLTPTTGGYDDYASIGVYTVSAAVGVCAGAGDPNEDDDDAGTARLLVPGQSTTGTRCGPDDDWLRVPGVSGTELTATLTAQDGDLSLELLDAASGVLTSVAATPAAPGVLAFTIPADADHFLRVSGAPGLESRYSLTTSLTTSCPPDDQYEGLGDVNVDDYINRTTPLALPGSRTGIVCDADTNRSDYMTLSLEAGRELTVDLHYADDAVSLEVFLFQWPASASSVAGYTSSADRRTLTYTPTVSGDYQLLVRSDGGTAPYHLTATQAPATVPGAPTAVTAVAGDGEATVSWSAPLDDGGSAIDGYSVTPYVGGVAQAPVVFGTSATTQTVSGLANGTEYVFTVAAVNAVGTGAESTASNAVVPAAADEVVLDPDAGVVGSQVGVSGTLSCPDQSPGSDVLVRFTDPAEVFQTGTNLAFTTYGADGTFSTTVQVPTEIAQLIPGSGIFPVAVEPGAYQIEVSCTASSAPSIPTVTAPFTVVQPPPTIGPGAAGITEGNAGTVVLEVPVSLSNPSAEPVTVDWSTLDTGAAGVATAGVDYEAASGTVTFAPGETTKVVSITVYGDLVDEPPLYLGEWILVPFSNPSTNAVLDTSFFGLGIGIIGDDDP